MTDWTRPPPDSEPPPGDEKAYESEDSMILEARCPSCGVILTTTERGHNWYYQLILCESCK